MRDFNYSFLSMCWKWVRSTGAFAVIFLVFAPPSLDSAEGGNISGQ